MPQIPFLRPRPKVASDFWVIPRVAIKRTNSSPVRFQALQRIVQQSISVQFDESHRLWPIRHILNNLKADRALFTDTSVTFEEDPMIQ